MEERCEHDGYVPYYYDVQVTEDDPFKADFISSRLRDDVHHHAPALDIDIPARLVASKTPGHSHLYLDVSLSWRQYKRLLKALAKAGVIEWSWYRSAVRSGSTLLTVPVHALTGRLG
jgi:hypothetical protein